MGLNSVFKGLRRVGGVEVYLNSFLASAVEKVMGELHVPAFLSLAKVPTAH